MSDPSDFDLTAGPEIDVLRTGATSVEMFEWFQRLWGLAVLAHIIGNPRVGSILPTPTALGLATLVAGLLAIAAVVLRYDRRLLVALCGSVLVVAWFEAPVLSNHWLLASFVSLAFLIANAASDSWTLFSATARSIFLVFYGFAAFAKLNSAFFDPSVSCSVVFANRSLSAVGLPVIDSASWLGAAMPYVTAGIELAIPLLLLVRRTRTAGVVLGLAFHGLISFDLDQHLYDFSAVLFALFLLWLPDNIGWRLGRPLSSNLRIGLSGLLGVFVFASLAPVSRISLVLLTQGVFVMWIPAVVALIGYVALRASRTAEAKIRPHSAWAVALVVVAIINGLTPYLELKTANSWNMYSNLTVADGESNHFIVRVGIPASMALANPIEIVTTDDPRLSRYVGSGYVLPRRNFLEYLEANPAVEVEFRQFGATQTVTGASGGERSPILIKKFVALRAIDTTNPTRCAAVWLPAH